MGIDARHLRCHVGAHAHHSAGELIGELEGLQVEIVAGAGEQGLEILDEGRHHQFVAPAGVEIQQAPTQVLDTPGLSGQDFLDAFGQQPAVVHVSKTRVMNS